MERKLCEAIAQDVIRDLGWEYPTGHPLYDRIRQSIGKTLVEALKTNDRNRWSEQIPAESLLRIYEIHAAWWTCFIPEGSYLFNLTARYFVWKVRRKRSRCMRNLNGIPQ